MRAKAGVMALGLDSYWTQFDGMKETVAANHAVLTNKLAAWCDVIPAGLVDTVDAARAAGHQFRMAGVDLVFCHCATYCPSDRLMLAVKDLDVVVVLLNLQPVNALELDEVKVIPDWLGAGCTCACLPEMTAILGRSGIRFDVVTGCLFDDPQADMELQSWCRAAGVRSVLRGKNLGFCGRAFAGMMDFYVDEVELLTKLGVYVRHLEFSDIVDEAAQVPADEIKHWLDKVDEVFGADERGEMQEVGRYTAALHRLVKRLDLFGLACHYAGNYKVEEELVAAMNPAFSLLMNEGIACTVEGDIQAAIAMLILKNTVGSATLAELYSMDFDDDICIVGHSGSGDPAVSAKTPLLKVSYVFHGRDGKGYLTQFYPKPGPVTLLALSQNASGFYLVAAEGICEDGKVLGLGDTNCRVRFPASVRDFVNAWSRQGPSHHAVLGVGQDLAAIRKIALLLDLPLHEVTI